MEDQPTYRGQYMLTENMSIRHFFMNRFGVCLSLFSSTIDSMFLLLYHLIASPIIERGMRQNTPLSTPYSFVIYTLFLTWKNSFHIIMWTCDYVYGNQFSHSFCCGRTCFNRSFHSTNITAIHNRYKSGTYLLFSD